MKKMLPILMIALLTVASVLCVSACGSKEETPEQPEKESEQKEEPAQPEEKEEEPQVTADNIQINTQSSIKIEGSKVIYIDPYKRTKKTGDADILLITHSHYDHMDAPSIGNVVKDGTVVVCPLSIKDELKGILDGTGVKYDLTGIEAGLEYTPTDVSKDIKIKGVPAYNTDKEFHKKEYGWLGYEIEMDGVRYFDAGDTDALKEHEDIKADIVFLPIGGTYTMTAAEAAELVNKMKPEIAIPIHYGSIVGSGSDADKFKDGALDGIKIVTKVEDVD